MPRATWWAMLALGCACVATTWASGYVVHDADSRLYAALSAEMSSRALHGWIAPVWNGHWGRTGLFVEHPPGHLWLGAALCRAGLPPFVALYAINFASWLGGLALLWRLGLQLAGRATAQLAVLLWALCPAFVQYLVRGDQEHPLSFAFLLGLTTATAWIHPGWVACGWALACTGAIAIKGVPGLALLPLGVALGLAQRRRGAWWWAMAAGTLMTGLAVAGFAFAYRRQTGTSFLHAYATGQVAYSVGQQWQWRYKAANMGYYLARPLWFGAPAVLVGVHAIYRRVRHGGRLGGLAAALGVGVMGLFIAAYSLADRKADRYLFPALPLLCLAAAAAHVAQQRPPGRQSTSDWRGDHRWLWVSVGVVWLAVCLKIYIGTYHYVFVRLWPGA